ncbi:MAG: alcohol dehydrogenase catalytic domain-containing protein [Chloroflexi bacterium]|nr:alcohol dehydrogenase catalytic domain-containing protein [Chloroflexota bacterium]
MRALELQGFNGPASLQVVDRPLPEPGAGEVRVRLKASALNHLDVFVSRGLPKRALPGVPGADGAGTVEAVGADVDESNIGREVVLYPMRTCGVCPACQAGQEVHCPKMAILGEQVDGTLQEAVVVPSTSLFDKPVHLTSEQAAALPLAWLTAWRLLFTRGGLKAGDSLVLVGIGGGVATACLLLARAHGLRVFATSREAAKRQRALDLGAEAAFPSDGFSGQVRQATDGRGATAVVDSVGPATIDESFRSLAREGVLLTMGATAGPKVELNLARLWFKHQSLVTSTMGNRSEFGAMLHDVQAYALVPPVDSVVSLEQAPSAFERLEAGEQFGKVILVP